MADINKNLIKNSKILEDTRNNLLKHVNKLKDNLDEHSKNLSLLTALFIGVILIAGVYAIPALNPNYSPSTTDYSTPVSNNAGVSQNTNPTPTPQPTLKHYKSNEFSLDYPPEWQENPASEIGKDCALYLVYGKDVQCIVWFGQFGDIDNPSKKGSTFEPSLAKEYKYLQDIYTSPIWEGKEISKVDINSNGRKGFIVIFKCNRNPDNEGIQPPFYVIKKDITKDNKNVYELDLMISESYYNENKDLIDKTIQSFEI